MVGVVYPKDILIFRYYKTIFLLTKILLICIFIILFGD